MTGPTAHQALYRRWRAQTFGQIVGQQAVVTTLRNAVRLGQLSHALLFVGPRGTGKTSMARIVAKAVNCLDLRDGEPCDRCSACVAIREGRALDLIEIDAASNRGINEIRALREGLPYAPTDLRRKVYILDEAHQITRDAWNALLKSLEEPPEHVTFIFASTEPSGFPAAILSRLQRFDFRPLTVAEIEGKLHTILEADGRAADQDALTLVATLAAGGMRDAESMLDQLLAAGDERLTADHVRDLLGLADSDAIDGFIAALATGDAVSGVRILDGLEERGRDVRTFLEQLVDAIRLTLLAGPRGRASVAGPPRDALLSAARRLAALDPQRSGPGGLRFQLELVLLEVRGSAAVASASERGSAEPPVPARDRQSAGLAPGAVDQPSSAPGTDRRRATLGARDGRKPAGVVDLDGAVPDTRDPATAASPATPEASGTPPEPAPPEPAAPEAAAPEPAPPELATPAEVRASRSDGPTVKPSRPVAETAAGSPRPPGPPGASPDLAQLIRQWPEIVMDVGRKPAVKPLIGACRPIGIDGNVVVLGFPENQVFLRDLLERRRVEIEEGISRHLGRPVGVRCVATNLDLAPAIPGDADAGLLLDEFHRIFAGDVADVPDVD